ncbi:hypothetical protein [Nocardia rhizosphaerihabitans]|uniref:hypothetical protein n=1 Tax=Nocardia rhizosphaerihabitans TaxID=1691570 RepID=UPI001E5E0A09|nr:hypothetical protein [Nocardia rhizosphaerihabitans]
MREFAVPPSMIDIATTRRRVGDWAGACAAAHVDVEFDLRALARTHGSELAARVRADLRHLAPDLLRWHLPRVAPDGLLRPGLTMVLARYSDDGIRSGTAGFVDLVVRTPPAWADAGQRISLALWDGSGTSPHPHPRPNRRFRLDLHRHLWDARRTAELRRRSGVADWAASNADAEQMRTGAVEFTTNDAALTTLMSRGCAVDRWAAEAAILLRAEQSHAGSVLVRYGARQRVVLDLNTDGDPSESLSGAAAEPVPRIAQNYSRGAVSALPVLPDAATWVLPDLMLLRAGAISADRLHPLVAAALDPACSSADVPGTTAGAGNPRIVECRGAQHRIGLVNGVLAALDHDPAEIRREELLVALTGTPLPCLQVIDQAHRRPDRLAGIRERLDHGDTAGALAVVEGLLGPDAQLRDGPLRDELESVVQRRITYGLFRAGLPAPGRGLDRSIPRPRSVRAMHPRHATSSCPCGRRHS